VGRRLGAWRGVYRNALLGPGRAQRIVSWSRGDCRAGARAAAGRHTGRERTASLPCLPKLRLRPAGEAPPRVDPGDAPESSERLPGEISPKSAGPPALLWRFNDRPVGISDGMETGGDNASSPMVVAMSRKPRTR
jgi:hypothetical protein